MKQLSSADFRKGYASETQPVSVTSYGKEIGRWYPTGFDAPAVEEANPTSSEPVLEPTPQRMTIRPAQVNPRGPLTGVERRIIDPIELNDREGRVNAQLQAKWLPQGTKR